MEAAAGHFTNSYLLTELFFIHALPEEYRSSAGNHDLLGTILCQALEVYCCHSPDEADILRELFALHLQWSERHIAFQGQKYEQATERVFWRSRPQLAWECIFPDGLDMEALSPRDVNARMRGKKQEQQKTKNPIAKLTGKEKDHPLPPPPEVYEPPSSDRPNGATYQTGKLLGKGGFAICYEGQLAGTNRKYALKIVKSTMAQKKMEQKFQTELQIHSKMKQCNIVQFHRAFSYDQCTFIVLELCPNGSLMDMVKARKFVTEPEVRYWTVQMAGAIKYMHAKGIIHRDLKMGNIFLDKDMNVKIGDFGLAALLISDKDILSMRRTTLCGTPNYIAPEILEKNKGGHDHAVDIWSLGIIIFAMLTGKPPFQSTTQDEIYRRAREREYDWPKLDTSANFISEQTKDLVASLLQGPEDRPDPDTIVQHPFFTCGWMPQSEEITPALRNSAPKSDQFLSIGIKAGKSNMYTKNLKKLCAKCAVGPWNTSTKRLTSTYKEVAAEEKAGLTPAVPLPEDIVYRPFDEWLQEEAQKEAALVGNAALTNEATLVDSSSHLRETEQQLPLSSRPATQSYAAQQRARPHMTAKPLHPESQPKAAQASSRPLLSIPSRHRPKSKKTESLAEEKVADVEGRLATDLAEQLNDAEVQRKSVERGTPMFADQRVSLFSPRDRIESVTGTRPDHVLSKLLRLSTELDRVLNTRTMANECANPASNPPIVVKWVDYCNKFGVGYILSNGSVGGLFKESLADESDASKGVIHPCSVLVRDSETHLRSRNDESYADRHEILPIHGPNVEFYENRGDKGFFRTRVSAQTYKVQISSDGGRSRIKPGVDDWDNRKRFKVQMWKKFANYMTAHGRDDDYPYDDVLARMTNGRNSEMPTAGNVVTFYQRFGDVGCWAFCDGHYQFNFPDHTKIVLSRDGTWCDFYHLPLEAARDLQLNSTLSVAALDDRQHLSYPLQTLLNFNDRKPQKTVKSNVSRKRPQINPMIQGVPDANDFRRKVEFIRQVVKEWATNGGLGNSAMDPKSRLKWVGYREAVNVKIPYKCVWGTLGRLNGDTRRVAWFDPRKPEAIIPDILE